MAKTEFKGRGEELKLLDDLWQSTNAALLILYGRRRVGKTRLLTHWMGQHNKQAVYWVAEPTSALDQLRSFSQTLYNFANPETPAPLEFTYANWEQALHQAAALTNGHRLALFIDEVTYLIDVDPSIIGVLQKAWDHSLSQSNLILALSGSQMGLMQNKILSYQAPLYGRATAQLKLPPLSFAITREFFPKYSIEERVNIYAVFGGIPAYWERLDPDVSVMENIRLQLLTSNTLMQEEPRLLLQDFISDPHNYVGIMRAIAHGSQTQSGIARRTGLSQGHISKYLSVLRETGFVERRVPVTESLKGSRRGRYYVTDPYLRFYYRFLSAYQTQLAIGAQQQSLTAIEQSLPQFIEVNTWRELCHQWLKQANVNRELPLPVERVGGAWTRSHAFDVVGINRAEKSLILGSCQWRDEPAGPHSIQDLVEKTSTLVPKDEGHWSVYYMGFASAGWSEHASEMANELANGHHATPEKAGGDNWRAVGVRLLDLAQVDADLLRWSQV
jgi:uncharacterized protein